MKIPASALAPRRARLAWSVTVLVLAAGCGKGAPGGPPGARGPQGPAPVTLARALRADVPVEVRAVGAAEAVSTVQILAQVSGVVQEVHFKEGDFVEKGRLLFTIDTRPYQATLSAAQAELEKNRALAEQAHVEVERYEHLAAEGLTSQQDLLKTKANAAALDATLGQNRATILGSTINVSYAAIRAPIAGRTGTLLVHAGNVVKANDRPMVVIRTLEPINVRFAVPEQHLTEIREHMKLGPVVVRAAPRGAGGAPVHGTLTFVENSVDASTGMIDLKARFANEGQALWPGQFVDAVVELATERGALVVPESAIQTGQEGAYAYVVGADAKATLRRVVVGRVQGERALIASGIAEGERVVTDGQVRLRDGTSVVERGGGPAAASSVARTAGAGPP